MEILKDTLIQLVVRNGADSARLSQTFKLGEPAFTDDTNRLYVGNGFTPGGVLVGNLYKGQSPTLTTLSPATSGDLGYNTSNNTLYVVVSGDGTSLPNWKPLANLSTPIYAKYNGLSGQTLAYSQNITSASWLSAGHYRFFFNALPTANLIPTTNIIGMDALGCAARPLTYSVSSCDVVVLSSDGSKKDANITLMINY